MDCRTRHRLPSRIRENKRLINQISTIKKTQEIMKTIENSNMTYETKNNINETQEDFEITREEYEVIVRVLNRLGMGDIIECGEAFFNIAYGSFSQFLTTQPQAVMTLAMTTSESEGRCTSQIQRFIESLEYINDTVATILETRDQLTQTRDFFDTLLTARQVYEEEE